MNLEPVKAWALIVPKKPRAGYDARVNGGDSRLDVFWTKQSAKARLPYAPHGARIVEVLVTAIKPLPPDPGGRA